MLITNVRTAYWHYSTPKHASKINRMIIANTEQMDESSKMCLFGWLQTYTSRWQIIQGSKKYFQARSKWKNFKVLLLDLAKVNIYKARQLWDGTDMSQEWKYILKWKNNVKFCYCTQWPCLTIPTLKQEKIIIHI